MRNGGVGLVGKSSTTAVVALRKTIAAALTAILLFTV